MVRLDKFLADEGIGTRSEVKKIIQKKQIKIDGAVVTDSSVKVDPEKMIIEYQGKRIGKSDEFEYYLLNKPAGCVSATEDSLHKTVLDYLPKSNKDLFPVGRLDLDTEGFLLITNDGKLAHELLSPKKHVPKTYYARVEGRVTEEDVKACKEGLDIGDDKLTLPAELEILSTTGTDSGEWSSEIHLTLHEGRFHQVKRMIQACGKKVVYLKRISMGQMLLPEDLMTGEYKRLTAEELKF